MIENLTSIDILRMLVLVVFSVRITRTDLRYKKIYNRDLIWMFASGLIFFLFGLNFNLLPSLATNFILASVFGIILWKMDIWGAGDGKLFAACSLYLPYRMYMPFFSAQVILLNVFVLAFLFWLIPLAIKTKRHEKIDALKAGFAPKNIINIFLVLFGVYYFIWHFVCFLGMGLYTGSFLISLTISLLAFAILQKLFTSRATYVFLIFALARPFFDPYFISFETIATIILTLFALLSAGAIGNLAMYISYTEKRLPELKVGDIPIGVMVKRKNNIADFRDFMEKKFPDKDNILKKGLSNKDLTIAKNINVINGFIVKKTISFTPLLFTATFVTIFIGTDILLYIASIIYNSWFYG